MVPAPTDVREAVLRIRLERSAAYGWRYCTEFEEKEVQMADTVRRVESTT